MPTLLSQLTDNTDECASSTTNNCDSNATCTNTPGSFTCTCNQGYAGNGTTCEGIYELLTLKVYHASHDFTVSDIDECIGTTNNCDSNAMCTNIPGSFTCTCNQGYAGNGATCEGTDSNHVLCNSCTLLYQILMSVPVLPLVTLMLHVPTLLGVTPVHVTKDTLEMEPLVKVLIPTMYYASHALYCIRY